MSFLISFMRVAHLLLFSIEKFVANDVGAMGDNLSRSFTSGVLVFQISF